MATPTILDTFVETIGSLAVSATISAGTNRKFYYMTLLTDGTAAVGLTGLTYGGQPMRLVGAATANDHNTCLQIWSLTEAGISAAVGTTLVPTGGTYTSQSSVHWTMEGAYQGKENFRAEFRNYADHALLGRQDNSWTFMAAMSFTATNTPVLTNPVSNSTFTFTDTSVAYGYQNETQGLEYSDWSNDTNQNMSMVCFNLMEAPSGLSVTEQPKRVRVTENQLVRLSGATIGALIGDIDVRLENAAGEQAVILNYEDSQEGGDGVINFKFNRPSTKQYSNTGYTLWISDGTNSVTTIVIPYLPPYGYSFIDVVSPNAGATIPTQYSDTFVTGDQCEYPSVTYPDRLPFSLDASLNETIGVVPKDQTVKVARITSAGVTGIVEYIDFLDGVSAATDYIADYRFREGSVNGDQPSVLADEIDPTVNNMGYNYDGGSVQWGETPTGRNLTWTVEAGAAFKFHAANSTLFQRLSNNNSFTVEMVCKPGTSSTLEGRALNIGTNSGGGDLIISPRGNGTQMTIGWKRDVGGGDDSRTLVYPALNDGDIYHIAVVINTSTITAADRLQLYINGVLVPPTSGSTPAYLDTINIDVAGRSVIFGNNASGGNGYVGSTYRASFKDCVMTTDQIKASAVQMLVASDASYAAPVSVTVDDLVTQDTSPSITGTTNRPYSYPVLTITDVSGNPDNYNTLAMGGKWEINTNPFNIEGNILSPVLSSSQRYSFTPVSMRLQNNDLIVFFVRGAGHNGLGQPSKFYARKSSDEFNFGAEYEIFGFTPPTNPVDTTAGTHGFVHPSTGEIWLVFAPVGQATTTGQLRRFPEELIKGDPTGTTFNSVSLYSNQDFYRYNKRVDLYNNGWILSAPWDRPVEFNGKLYQTFYGSNQSWLCEWDDTNEIWTNKQTLFDVSESSSATFLSEVSMIKIDEQRAVFLVRGNPVDNYFSVRGEFDASGNFSLIDSLDDPESTIPFSSGQIAGCTMRGILVGDNVHIVNGERHPNYNITHRKFYKEDLWENRRIACCNELQIVENNIYNLTPITAGSYADQGMPDPFPILEDGVEIDYAVHVFFYDSNNTLIPGDPSQHHEAFGVHATSKQQEL